MFSEHFTPGAMASMFGLPRSLPADYDFAQHMFVAFADFEPVAIQDVHRSVTKKDLADFEASLRLGDEFWCTQRAFGPPIVFVRTEAQATALKQSAAPDRWADTYFAIARRYDEFDYLCREEFFIAVDSKENFDANYSSNWYYNFK